jgi:HlyD family secretion protein
MRLGLGAVRLPRTRTARWITAGVAVVAVAAIVTAALALAGGGSASPTNAASTVSTVRRGAVSLTASAAGTVQAVATRGLSFSVGGTVTEINVHTGDSVTAGQVLARVDSSDAQTTVNSAQDAVNSAQNAVTTAESPTPPPASGACMAPAAYRLPTGASPSPSTSPSPSATTRPSQSPTSPPGGGDTGGTSGGGTSGGGSSGGSGTTGGGSSTGHSGSGSGCGTGTGTTGGNAPGGGRGGSTDSLFSAEQQLNNAQLALTQAQQKLAGTVITAPVAGKVLSVTGTVGGTEAPGSTSFITLGGVDDTEITAQFTESDVAHLAVGQSASITLPDRAGQKYTGKVSQVSPAGTTSGRLVRYAVLIAFDQVPADLLYGQSANVAVTTQSVANVLYVSSSAVTNIANGTGTVTVRANGHDERRIVHIGLRGDQYTEIQSGLSQGEAVVVGGR